MTDDEIRHLGQLARITIDDSEVATLRTDTAAVLAYVSTINEIAADGTTTKQVGPVFNVLRPDEVTNEAGSHTEALLASAPKRTGQFIEVKKVLDQ